MDYYKVEGHDNLYRDPNTGAIFTTKKPSRNTIKKHFDSTSDDINSLKEEIRELKLLLLEHIKRHG
jgi:hypothetical protein